MSTSGDELLRRAQEDIADNRLWKARDRLTSAIKARPTDQRVLELLGEVHFAMGDHPSAGRYWLLTARSGSKAETAMVAFEERWGRNLGEKLKLVPFTGSLDDYPAEAHPRIRSLQDAATAAGLAWPQEKSDAERPGEGDKLAPRDLAVLMIIAVLGPGLWLFGLVALIYLVVS